MKTARIIPCLLAGLALVAQDDPKDNGPTTLIIAYRCNPAQRFELREYMELAGVKRFEEWKHNGILSNYRILFSRYVDTNNWDMLAILSFANYDNVEKWKYVERRSPSGLPPNVLAMTIGISTYPADVFIEKASDATVVHPVYFVIPYTYSVPTPEYLQYVRDYVQPQFDGWIEEGILVRYEMFLQRYTPSRPWDSLIVLEYKDDASFGLREKTVAKVRERLKSNPTWKALSDNKHSVRLEKEPIVADELTLR